MKRMKDSLEQAMLDVDMKRIKTELFTFNIQKNPPSLDVVDESKIPDAYFDPQPPKLDKKFVLMKLKEGTEIPGVQVRQGESLRIR